MLDTLTIKKIRMLTYEKQQLIKDNVCDSCKNNIFFLDANCHEWCDAFAQQMNDEIAEGTINLEITP